MFTGMRMRVLSGVTLGLAISLAAAIPQARAADLAVVEPMFKPAVDAINGKVEAYGGWGNGRFGRDDTFTGGAIGSFSAPLGPQFGLQIDGALGSNDNRLTYGAAGHLFTRNPDKFLLGAYGSVVGADNTGGAWGGKIGGEAEVYLGQFTASGVAGFERLENGDDKFRFSKKSSFFDYFDLSYYLTDDFKLSLGHRYTGRTNAAAFGGEYRLPVTGVDVSVFGEGRVGEDNYRTALGGVRVYLGSDQKSLIERQRQSDPATYLKDDLFSLTAGKRLGGGAGCVPPAGPGPVDAAAACPTPK